LYLDLLVSHLQPCFSTFVFLQTSREILDMTFWTSKCADNDELYPLWFENTFVSSPPLECPSCNECFPMSKLSLFRLKVGGGLGAAQNRASMVYVFLFAMIAQPENDGQYLECIRPISLNPVMLKAFCPSSKSSSDQCLQRCRILICGSGSSSPSRYINSLDPEWLCRFLLYRLWDCRHTIPGISFIFSVLSIIVALEATVGKRTPSIELTVGHDRHWSSWIWQVAAPEEMTFNHWNISSIGVGAGIPF